MLIAVVAIIGGLVAWLVMKRVQRGDPALSRAGWRWVIACLGAAIAVRASMAGPVLLRVALGLLAIAALVVWLRRRGGGGWGDDGRDPPVDPEPDPGEGQRAPRPRERLDPDAFDRARAEWEQPLKSADGR